MRRPRGLCDRGRWRTTWPRRRRPRGWPGCRSDRSRREWRPGPLGHTTEGPAIGRAEYRGDYLFTAGWFTRHVPVWRAALAPFAGRPGVRYPGVGHFEGRSALWMLENVLTDPTSRLVGIDPFLMDGTERRHRANLEPSGAGDRATTIAGLSGASCGRCSRPSPSTSSISTGRTPRPTS